MLPEKRKYQLREIDPDVKADVRTAARLHKELLDWGPICKLGGYFLEKYIYSKLVREGLINAALFEVDGDVAGFVAYTSCSYTFHRKAIRDDWYTVGYLMTLSIMRNPLILFRMMKAVREILGRRSENALKDESVGELLAIGVKQKYLSPDFIFRNKLRISELLFEHVEATLRDQGISRMRLIVDKFNQPALIFYHGLGGRFESVDNGGNEKVHIWFDL
jgi:ribosomal protein S18 acetylase RimI-like enzyme